MLSTPSKSNDLQNSLREETGKILQLQSEIDQLQLEIKVVQKTAEEDKQRLETIHQTALRDQQRKFEEELNQCKLQLQLSTTTASQTKADYSTQIQTLNNKLNEERDKHAQDITKLMSAMKEIEQLKEQKRELSANLSVIQSLSDQVCILLLLFFIIFSFFFSLLISL